MASVLVVDDDPDLRDLLEHRLRRAGHVVVAAGSGQQALDLLAAGGGCPDVAVLDVLMPGLSGLELLARLRQDPTYADMPAIVLSGRVQREDVALATALGAVHLGKPVSLAALLQAVGDATSPGVPAARP